MMLCCRARQGRRILWEAAQLQWGAGVGVLEAGPRLEAGAGRAATAAAAGPAAHKDGLQTLFQSTSARGDKGVAEPSSSSSSTRFLSRVCGTAGGWLPSAPRMKSSSSS